jgi:ribonuclease HI
MVMHPNVAAELQAVRHGLDHCLQQKYSAVTVYYDYNGIEAWATGQWQANTRTTLDYLHYIRTYPLPITWEKVAAHSGIPMNELVDSLATAAARNSSTRYTEVDNTDVQSEERAS